MYTCPKCRRVLQHATRNALCLKCVVAASGDPGGFEDDVKTVPGIRPAMLRAAAAAS